MMANLNAYVADQSNIGKVFTSGDKSYTLAKADNFSYTDPVDHSISKNQVSKKRDSVYRKNCPFYQSTRAQEKNINFK